MIYRCTCCHLIFDEPDVMRRRENLDGERLRLLKQFLVSNGYQYE